MVATFVLGFTGALPLTTPATNPAAANARDEVMTLAAVPKAR